jgi:hypothetical protein
MVRRPVIKTNGGLRMRKLIIATTALAFLSSTAFSQTSTTPPATGGDTMSKGDTMKKTTKTNKKSAKKTDDATKDATKQ